MLPSYPQIMAKKPDAVHSCLFGGDLLAFTKQTAPYDFFEKTPFLAQHTLPALLDLGEDAPEGTRGLGRGCFFMGPNPPANLMSIFLTCKEVLPHMVRQGGGVISESKLL